MAEVRNGVVLGLEPIQSGLVIPRSVWHDAGPFRAGLFIDSVDTEYFMRLSDVGFETVLAAGTHLGHSLGGRFHPTIFGRRLRLGGRDVSLVRSAEFRYYYLARNRVLMNRAFGARHRAWSMKRPRSTLDTSPSCWRSRRTGSRSPVSSSPAGATGCGGPPGPYAGVRRRDRPGLIAPPLPRLHGRL